MESFATLPQGISSTPAATPQDEGNGSPAPLAGRQTRDTFLRLLIAQIRNQDPLNPLDPTNFVSQLAEFSSLETLLGIRESMATIEQELTAEGGAPDEEGANP